MAPTWHYTSMETTQTVVESKDVTGTVFVSHTARTLRAAVKMAKRHPGHIIIHYPETTRTNECWQVARPAQV